MADPTGIAPYLVANNSQDSLLQNARTLVVATGSGLSTADAGGGNDFTLNTIEALNAINNLDITAQFDGVTGLANYTFTSSGGGGGSGTITQITSTDTTIKITDPEANAALPSGATTGQVLTYNGTAYLWAAPQAITSIALSSSSGVSISPSSVIFGAAEFTLNFPGPITQGSILKDSSTIVVTGWGHTDGTAVTPAAGPMTVVVTPGSGFLISGDSTDNGKGFSYQIDGGGGTGGAISSIAGGNGLTVTGGTGPNATISLPTATAGNILIGNGSVYTPLAIDTTAGHVLTSTGTTAQWAAPSGGSGVTSLTSADTGLLLSGSTGAITITNQWWNDPAASNISIGGYGVGNAGYLQLIDNASPPLPPVAGGILSLLLGILTLNSSDSSGVRNVVLAKTTDYGLAGTLLVGNGNGKDYNVLPVGSNPNGSVLTLVSGVPQWAPASGGSTAVYGTGQLTTSASTLVVSVPDIVATSAVLVTGCAAGLNIPANGPFTVTIDPGVGFTIAGLTGAGAGFATIGVATPGTDYIVDLSTQTGLIIGTPTDEGVLPINFPTDGAATGSLLVYNSSLGSGEYVPFPVGASGDVLTATTVSPTHPLGLTWSPSGGGGSGANWSLYPALADVDMYSFVSPNPLTYYGIRRAQYLTFEPLNDNYPADTNPALWVTPGVAGNPPSLVYGTNIDGEIITQTVVTSVENSTYGSQGSLLIGIGGGYAPTAVGSVGQVLTVQNVEGEGITPIWAPPIVIPPHLTVDCVVWIQNWQTIILQGGGNITPIWPTYTNGIPSAAYTYANGISGVGATITFNSAGSFVAADSDNISLSLNSRILFVDNTSNGVANGIYKVTTLGTGSVAMVWQRTTDFDTPAQILDGVPIFVKGGTVFGGQTVTFSTSSAVTIVASGVASPDTALAATTSSPNDYQPGSVSLSNIDSLGNINIGSLIYGTGDSNYWQNLDIGAERQILVVQNSLGGNVPSWGNINAILPGSGTSSEILPGDLLVGSVSGGSYTALGIGASTIGETLQVLSSTEIGFGPSPTSNWSVYPATQSVSMNYYNITQAYEIRSNIYAIDDGTNAQTLVPGAVYTLYGNSAGTITNSFLVSSTQTNYGQTGSILTGNGVDYNVLPIGTNDQVLTVVAGNVAWQPVPAPTLLNHGKAQLDASTVPTVTILDSNITINSVVLASGCSAGPGTSSASGSFTILLGSGGVGFTISSNNPGDANNYVSYYVVAY
ncbi:unnamed protein product [Sphagnum jensenii]